MSQGSRSGSLTAYALYAAGTALMAANPLIGRAVAHTVPPVGMAFWRWLLAFLIVLPFALAGLKTHRHAILGQWRRFLLLGVLGQGISGAVVYMGLERTSATNASLIYAMSPVMILIIAALWLREQVGARQLAGIGLAIVGVAAILTRGELEALLALRFNVGDLLILAGATSWAVYTILLRGSRTPLPVVTAFAANALAGVLVLAPFYVWETLAVRPVPATATTLLSILGVALFASVLAFVAYQKTIAMMGPARAGTALYVSPLWTALAATVLLGEQLQAFHLLGALLILPGVAMATWPQKPATAPCPAEA
ncbi:DMT family transporter [Azospirillum thermophilum]|uniref:EamA/RhaT family transporter n=1 Tax=Azospirillum thermophilum TaxID=2202148 RepID=A0A2S2CLX6_9PROT|nr:DMT family transporter [Azospirillum thermophilum]AWK85472.1 EamA/RhaT family transporter [Azospirillum thermophilum]